MGFARQEVVSRVIGWFLNRTEPFIMSKPGPLAGYLDPLLTQSTTTWHCVDHIGLCYSPKIRYIVVLSKSLYIYTYGDTGITEMDSATGSIYLGDPGVDRHHLTL